jgi:hypothetical protein
LLAIIVCLRTRTADAERLSHTYYTSINVFWVNEVPLRGLTDTSHTMGELSPKIPQLPTSVIQYVFLATIVAKLTYASPARWSFALTADKALIEAFLRRSVHFDYRADSAPTLDSICAAADDKLFALIKSNLRYLLHRLLPFSRNDHYKLQDRSHNFQLPHQTTALHNFNFLMRILYKNCHYSSQSNSAVYN